MAKRDKAALQEPAFEELLAEAETLAERMEEGGLSLEESIRAYERGVDNLRRCAALLKGAEEKVKVLLEKNGEFRLDDLDPEDGEQEDAEADDEDGY